MRPDLVVTPWCGRFMGQSFPVAIGRGGIVSADAKREGDGATPAGTYRVTALWARADRLRLPAGARPSPLGLAWCDDPDHPAYNLPVAAGPGHPESLRRADRLYDILAATDHNAARTPGLGSAIFLHCWRAPRVPTAGCVALSPARLAWVLARWRPASRLVIRG